jgi:hypothetical protein
MAAISARLANMGFMKRGAASSAVQQPQGPEQPAPQQQSLRAACKQEAAAVQQQQQQASHPPAAPAAAAASSGAAGNSSNSSMRQQGSKYKLSDNIANMKFMQRAQLKRSREDAFEQDQAAKDEAEWVSATAVQDKGVLILHERDPLPAGANGRMCFGFGQAHDLAQAEEAERQAAAEAAATEKQVQDGEMGRFGMSMRASRDGTPKRDFKRQRR